MVLQNGDRFWLAWYAPNAKGNGFDVGIEVRVNVAGGSRVEAVENVRTFPNEKCARIWVAEWNRLEADHLLAVRGMVERDGVPVAR